MTIGRVLAAGTLLLALAGCHADPRHSFVVAPYDPSTVQEFTEPVRAHPSGSGMYLVAKAYACDGCGAPDEMDVELSLLVRRSDGGGDPVPLRLPLHHYLPLPPGGYHVEVQGTARGCPRATSVRIPEDRWISVAVGCQ